MVFGIKVFGQIFVLLGTSHRTTNVVSSLQELIDDMASDGPIDARHEDSGTWPGNDRRHSVQKNLSRGEVDTVND